MASDAIEGSAVSVVVEVLPAGEEFGEGGTIGLYGIIGIGIGIGAGTVPIAPLPCCWPETAAAVRRVGGKPTGFD